MTKIILTYGDSNTHGTPPIRKRGVVERYDAKTRWPKIMQSDLGHDWELIEEGLPGRTTSHTDPVMGPHMNGQIGLRIALQSHGPIDQLVIMMGTNDLKAHFGLTAAGVTAGVAGLLAIAKSDEYQTRHGGFDVLLVCPPSVIETGSMSDVFYGAAAKSVELPALYGALAAHWNVGFLDAGAHINPSHIDGVHFDADAHTTLGHAVAAAL